ncbi:MAG TPA: septation protein A [Alphaproteobacteria bacterium]|nr:septation protein A [Alphaproteobacteria bacterium]
MTQDTPHPAPSPLLRLALEAGPLVVFFIANRMEGIMTGTAVFMAATLVAVGLSYRLERRIPLMPLVGCGFVMVFGGLTLWLDDAVFIKLKPTVVNLLFAAILFVGLATGRTFLKLLMGSVMTLTDEGWRILSWRWAFFFVFLAGLNEVVWRTLPTDAWVNFKVFALMPLTIVFAMAQLPVIMRTTVTPEGEAGSKTG